MGHLAKAVPRETLHAEWWAADETATIKTFASGYDNFRMRSAITAAVNRQKERNPGASVDTSEVTHEVALTLLEMCLVEWTLSDEDGVTVPLTAEFIRERLPTRDFEFLVAEINKRLALWGADEPVDKGAAGAKGKSSFRKDGVPRLQGASQAARDTTRDGGRPSAVALP